MPFKNDLTQKAYQRAYQQQYKRRKKRVSVVLSPRDYQVYERLAKRDKRSIGGQLKTMADAYRKKEVIVPGDLKDRLDALTFQLRAMGNNINQIAVNLNIEAFDLPDYSENDARHILGQIWEGLAAVEKQVKASFLR